ncbi:hypothetical protein KI688_011351 [Linnemannia hyalina]|uniref:Uncharacterized protein n=1 Tax=Linnemannia hyalina TaxID=64524 RepID=A0A9P8BT18_9FUNG|nr:hypothetical protein KI688_011351 [Linnemannia hyalina]
MNSDSLKVEIKLLAYLPSLSVWSVQVGSMDLPFAIAINNKVVVAQSLGDSTYIVFISLMAIGTLIALSLCPPTSVAHSNGDKIQIQAFLAWTGEVVAFSQIGGSWTFACVLDYQGVSRKTRSLWGLIIITACFVATWIGGIFFQKGASYVGPLFLYMFYGLNDAVWQTYCYWLMGVLSNDVTCIQSSGAAIAKRINAVGTPYMTELIICFALLIASLLGALFLTMRIKDPSDEPTSEYYMQTVEGKLEIIA